MSDLSSHDPQLDPLVGQVLAGKYHILEPIARGGMSRIYRAVQQPLDRVVAVKLLTPLASLGPESEMRERFLREAATVARLRHPNTVTIHDYGTLDNGMLFMVMEFVDGRNLAKEIRVNGPIEPPRAAKIACEVLRSLHEAHTMGVIHRDLKSSNIMLVQTVEGEAVKVVDFGIAKVLDSLEGSEPDGVTLGNTVLGSPGYMAPEQIVGGAIDPRTDVYAVGAVLYEMLSGRRPFRGETSFQTMMAHIQEDPIPLRDVCQFRISDELNALIEACLSKSPAARPESAAALLTRLRSAVPEMPWSSSITLDFRRSDLFGRSQPPAPVRVAKPHMMIGGALIAFLLTAWLLALATASFALYATMQAGQVASVPSAAVPTLTIRSLPTGAEVFQGESSLGHTPLVIPIARNGPDEVYRLELEGFEPISITQGPAVESGTLEIELEPASRRPKPAAPEPVAPQPDAPQRDAATERGAAPGADAVPEEDAVPELTPRR